MAGRVGGCGLGEARLGELDLDVLRPEEGEDVVPSKAVGPVHGRVALCVWDLGRRAVADQRHDELGARVLRRVDRGARVSDRGAAPEG